MTNKNLQQQIALGLLPNIGCRRMRKILSHTGTVDNFFRASKKELLSVPGLGEQLIRNMDRDLALKTAEPYAEYYEKTNFKTHFFQDEDFPKRLNECPDAPLLLFSSGNMDFNVRKVVAVVGTRNVSEYGKAVCSELIRSFLGKNVLVVSGLAYGIDVFVHRLCVKNNIQTIGVLGHGLERVYPSVHTGTAREMEANGGLLSEFLPGTNPDRENFPMRNRIVAGMCDATIVVESGIKGGSLITAELANDYNRDVFTFPGDIQREHSKGCNFLIQKNKAHLITGSRDFLEFMDWDEEKKSKVSRVDLFTGLGEEEKSIVLCLRDKPQLSFDNLMHQTKLPFSKLSSTLLSLEFSGLIKSLPGKLYGISA